MRDFALFLRKGKIASTLVLTVLLLLVGGGFAAGARAQDAADAPPPEAPPPPAIFFNRIPADQLAFLSGYAGRTAKEIQKDKRFRALMKLAIPRTVFHYGIDMPLDEAVTTMLDGELMPIEIREGRYVMVASRGGEYLAGRGFLWFDMQEGIALGGAFFHPTNGEPTPTLAIFSRQVKDKTFAMSQLPGEFALDLAEWTVEAVPILVSPRYFIPENGKKYVLLHDEDFCADPLSGKMEDRRIVVGGFPAPAPSVPLKGAASKGVQVPQQDPCEMLNAAAADADVEAAFFINANGNAANATAFAMQSNQVAWFRQRDLTCGVVIGCKIRITRQRTRVLLGPQRN